MSSWDIQSASGTSGGGAASASCRSRHQLRAPLGSERKSPKLSETTCPTATSSANGRFDLTAEEMGTFDDLVGGAVLVNVRGHFLRSCGVLRQTATPKQNRFKAGCEPSARKLKRTEDLGPFHGATDRYFEAADLARRVEARRCPTGIPRA